MSCRPFPASPAVVGILNLTPDSFSDGGLLDGPESAIARGLQLVAEGAAALDIGAESTRPGAREVAGDDQRRVLLPVVRALRERAGVPLSVDTRDAATAEAALRAGADAVNDVSMLRRDPGMARIAAREGATLVVMHSRGTPEDMASAPRHADVVAEVIEDLRRALDRAIADGVERGRLVADPGFGFAKTGEESLRLLRELPALLELGCPLMVGLSRKSLVGTILGSLGAPRPVGERAHGSVGLALAAWLHGASYLRVHDVAATCDALTAFRAAVPAREGDPPSHRARPPRAEDGQRCATG